MPPRRTRSAFSTSQKKIWADAAYRGQELATWCQAEGTWDLEVVEHAPGQRGFSVQPRRWVVERSLGWISRTRRLSKDYERKVQTSETLIQVAMIRLLDARLGRSTSPLPTDALSVLPFRQGILNGRGETQSSTVFLSPFDSVLDRHWRRDPLQKIKHVLRGSRQTKLLTEKDGTIQTGLGT
jgi:transposase